MDSREMIEERLDKAILDSLDKIEKLPAGSKERFLQTKEAAELYKARDGQYRAESEYNATIDAKEQELKAKKEELCHEKDERRKDRVVQSLSTFGTLAFWAFQFAKCLKFEETGTATSTVFKTLFKAIKM